MLQSIFFIQVLKVMGVQENQLQAIQVQIEYWEDIITANIKDRMRVAFDIQTHLDEIENPHEDMQKAIAQAMFSNVIAFLLFRMKYLIQKHKELALAHLPDQLTTLHENKQITDLTKLLYYSFETFKNIEELQKQYNNKAEKFDKINRNAVNACSQLLL